jgi:periplasmic protein TonB
MSSMAARACLASLFVHASVAVALVSGPRVTKTVASATIDIEEPEATLAVAPPGEPRSVVVPEDRQPQPDVVVHVAPTATHARVETSLHPAKVLRVNSEGRTEGDDAPDVVVAEPGTRARFVMAFGSGGTVTGGLAKSSGNGTDETETYAEAGVSSRARLLEGTPPEYPPAARAAAVEADLPLEIVVDAGGTVVDARLLKHAGFGLDEAALRAVRGYRFIPAQRAGHGVSVRMRWVVDFRLD